MGNHMLYLSVLFLLFLRTHLRYTTKEQVKGTKIRRHKVCPVFVHAFNIDIISALITV